MSKILNSIDCPNMPWEEKPENYPFPVWRYSKNPITKRPYSDKIDRVFNSSLVKYNDEYIGVFRADSLENKGNLYVGHSKDGINIELEENRIVFFDEDGNEIPLFGTKFDPRVIPMDDRYYIVYCDYTYGVTSAIAWTKDFKHFTKMPNPFITNFRNGVLFPRKINDKYYMLIRPCDSGNTKFGNIFISESKELRYWGNNDLIKWAGFSGWNWTKIGGGPAPIETDEGWLIFIHGVTSTCSGWVYAMGALILDRDNPKKVLYTCKPALLTPQMNYEQVGFTPNVVFPTSTIVDSKTGRIAIYYGAADSYTALAFTEINELVKYIKENSIEGGK